MVFRSTDRIMIFCRRSYMCPDAMVKMCTASGSSSADRRKGPAVPPAWPALGACPGASHDAMRPHSDPACNHPEIPKILMHYFKFLVCTEGRSVGLQSFRLPPACA